QPGGQHHDGRDAAGPQHAGPPAAADPQTAPPVPGASTAPPVQLPGVAAEANSHVMPGRSRRMAGFAPQPAASGPPDDATIQLIVPERGAAPAVPPEVRPLSPEGRPTVPAQPGGSGRHARPPAPDPYPAGGRDPYPAGTAEGALTGSGLPKRTPRSVPQAVTVSPPRQVRKGVDAEALRAKLAGFQQGAREGRRDVEQELAGREGGRRRAAAPSAGGDVGDVEEARG
ncbi:hypothetical protein ABT104_34200, partial [Streptomyces mobaraensis]